MPYIHTGGGGDVFLHRVKHQKKELSEYKFSLAPCITGKKSANH